MEKHLTFNILTSSGVPIYRQIIEQAERMIAMGTLRPGDTLPSVRQLSGELEVNPMTISKAYMLLESQGVLTRRRGLGMVVAERKAVHMPLPEKLALLAPPVHQLVTLAHQLELTPEQIVAYIKSQLEGTGHDE